MKLVEQKGIVAVFMQVEYTDCKGTAVSIGVNLSPKAEALGYTNEVRLRGLASKARAGGLGSGSPRLSACGH